MTNSQLASIPGLCHFCRIRQTQINDIFCTECRRVSPEPFTIGRVGRIAMGWIAGCIFDVLLGFGIASVLLMPFALISSPAQHPIHQLQTWLIGLVVLLVMAVLVAGIQGFFLRDWIAWYKQWSILSAASLFLIWPLLLITNVIVQQRITGIATVIEGFIGIGIAFLQSRLFPSSWNMQNKWFIGASLIWFATAITSIAVEIVTPDPDTGIIYAFVTSRAVFGALAGVWLGLLIWGITRKYKRIEQFAEYGQG